MYGRQRNEVIVKCKKKKSGGGGEYGRGEIRVDRVARLRVVGDVGYGDVNQE